MPEVKITELALASSVASTDLVVVVADPFGTPITKKTFAYNLPVSTPTQTAFDRKTRQANLKNAFALAPGVTLTPGQQYVLVDDVFTTGSTLNSCARVLRRAGALKLDVVTFAHG